MVMVEGHVIKEEKTSAKRIDIFRDTPVRLLGYANEVGEAFRNFVPKGVVIGSYVVASGYAIADASSKATEVYQSSNYDVKFKRRRSIEMFVEAAVWQGLASVIIPGFTINRICLLTRIVLNKYARTALQDSTRKLIVTGTGLSAIPFIIKPIDSLVDKVLEEGINLSRKLGLSHTIPHQKDFHEILEKTQSSLENDPGD